MNIFLIHGDDNEKSYLRLRKFILEAQKRNWEVIYLDESPYSLYENVSSSSLFSEVRFFVHRDFSKLAKKDLEWLSENNQKYEGNIVFYYGSPVPRNQISKLPKNSKIEDFKLPKLIWKFLDSFYPGNSAEVIYLFHKIQEEAATDFIFGLLSRHTRDLYMVKNNPGTKNYPGWRISKLKNQLSKFGKNSLEIIISKLADVDLKSKTSQAKLDELLDFIIIEELA